MRSFRTEKRLKKITDAVKSRQPSLGVILENIHDPHNVSAIIRSCDAVGVSKIGLLYTIERFPRISKTSSSSAVKWVDKERYTDTKECFDKYHERGFKIYSSLLAPDAVSLYDLDLTEKVVFVLGNENRGVSKKAAELADLVYYIPMRGMIQSLNVSVAAAVTLYEAQRQRMMKGMYEKSELPDEEIERLIDDWCKK